MIEREQIEKLIGKYYSKVNNLYDEVKEENTARKRIALAVKISIYSRFIKDLKYLL
jgi:hypothetical protein